jgi:hypothetical protein
MIDNEFKEYINAKLYEYINYLKEDLRCKAIGTRREIFYYFYKEFKHFITKDFD